MGKGRKAYVLLSGGIDSTTCLYLAQRDFGEAVGLSVFYGQRHKKEIEYAARSCVALGAEHYVLNIAAVMPRTMLTDPGASIPSIDYADIKGVSPTYVPFRNGLLLAAATAHVVGAREMLKRGLADAHGIVHEEKDLLEWGLYFGAHAEDAQNWAYPDCTPEFIGAMSNAIYVGTYRELRLHTPLEWLGKADIIRLGQSLGVSWADTWSCYAGGEVHCGECPTCRARRAGFVAAGVADPTVYARAAAA